MYWKVIDENRKQILKKILDIIELKKFYMAGGTALALQNGTRESFDFDFFVQEQFDTNLLLEDLKKIGETKVTFISNTTLHCILENVKLTFLYFPNKLIDKTIKVENFKNLYLASIKDIAAMKLIAISQRGAKKDFFDLYSICKEYNYSINDILKLLDIKYESNHLNYFHIIKSIIYFNDAEDEILPKVFIEYSWEKIKNFYITEYKKLNID